MWALRQFGRYLQVLAIPCIQFDQDLTHIHAVARTYVSPLHHPKQEQIAFFTIGTRTSLKSNGFFATSVSIFVPCKIQEFELIKRLS